MLEASRQAELPFIFKGGTSLLLLPETPRRLSTDIDINQPGRNGAYLCFLSAQTSRSLRKKYLTVWRLFVNRGSRHRSTHMIFWWRISVGQAVILWPREQSNSARCFRFSWVRYFLGVFWIGRMADVCCRRIDETGFRIMQYAL